MPLERIFFEGQKHDLIKPRTLTHEGKYFDGDIVEKTTKEIKHLETKLQMQNWLPIFLTNGTNCFLAYFVEKFIA